ncbi:hypothetical protein EPO44_10350 [bacterium]|nr:MAG: hypothetical protein EPO44_10350 [bacterium]
MVPTGRRVVEGRAPVPMLPASIQAAAPRVLIRRPVRIGTGASVVEPLGAVANVRPPTPQEMQMHNPYGASGFLGVNPLNGQPVWDPGVLATSPGNVSLTLDQQLEALRIAQELAARALTYNPNPTFTNPYSGEVNPLNPAYYPTLDSAQRIASIVGGAVRAIQNPGRSAPDYFIDIPGGASSMNAGELARLIAVHGLNSPTVQGMIRPMTPRNPPGTSPVQPIQPEFQPAIRAALPIEPVRAPSTIVPAQGWQSIVPDVGALARGVPSWVWIAGLGLVGASIFLGGRR